MSSGQIPPAMKFDSGDSFSSTFYEDEYLWERRDGLVYKFHTENTKGKTTSISSVYCGQCYLECLHDSQRDEYYCLQCG